MIGRGAEVTGKRPLDSRLERDEDSRAFWGTSSVRNHLPVGTYSRAMPRALWWSYGEGRFLMGEIPP